MLTVYGSKLCPDCVMLKKNCDTYGIAYEFKDITESLLFMKEFLKLRDASNEFDEAKASGSIGIPCILNEGQNLTLDWKKVVTENGFTPFEEEKKTCSLNNRSGC